jgi:hypothetical protein
MASMAIMCIFSRVTVANVYLFTPTHHLGSNTVLRHLSKTCKPFVPSVCRRFSATSRKETAILGLLISAGGHTKLPFLGVVDYRLLYFLGIGDGQGGAEQRYDRKR